MNSKEENFNIKTGKKGSKHFPNMVELMTCIFW